MPQKELNETINKLLRLDRESLTLIIDVCGRQIDILCTQADIEVIKEDYFKSLNTIKI